MASKYRHLDGRLHDSPFDPSVPYFLDEEGSVHDLTDRRETAETRPAPAEPEKPARPGLWQRLAALLRRR